MCKHVWEPVFGDECNSWCTECGMLRRVISVGHDVDNPELAIKTKYVYKRPKLSKEAHLICREKCDRRKEIQRRKKIGEELTRIKSNDWIRKNLSKG